MKKGNMIVPQHIPNGQGYTEESLRELNDELRRFAPKGIAAMVGSFVGCLTLASIFMWGVGGFIGNLLALIMAISMPICVVAFSKLSQLGYINAAKKIGINPDQLKEAINNRNNNKVAWGTLDDVTTYYSDSPNVVVSPKDTKKAKKKQTKIVLITIVGVMLVCFVVFLCYDAYLTKTSNRLVVEITAKNGTISQAQYEEIVEELNSRADEKNANNEDNIPIELKIDYKDGVITCESNSNMLNDYSYQQFYGITEDPLPVEVDVTILKN